MDNGHGIPKCMTERMYSFDWKINTGLSSVGELGIRKTLLAC